MQKVILLVILSIPLIGCDQIGLKKKPQEYEFVKNADGTVYRLNKETGEMASIKDGAIIPLKDQETVDFEKRSDEEETQALAELFNWPTTQIPGKNLFVEVGSNWRNDQINIDVKITPKEALEGFFDKRDKLYDQAKELQDKYNRSSVFSNSILADIKNKGIELETLNQNSITLTALDKAGMPVIKFDIPLTTLIRLIGPEGSIPVAYGCQLSEKLTKEDYLSIANVSLQWNIDEGILIDLKASEGFIPDPEPAPEEETLTN